MNLLDFAKMKKVASDGKTSSFEHENGHKIVIMHAALPKLMQEQIKRLPMADGGKIKGVHEPINEESEVGRGKSMAGVASRAAAEGGQNKEFRMDRAKSEHRRVIDENRDIASKDRKYLDEGTPDGTVENAKGDSAAAPAPAASDSGSHPNTININLNQPSADRSPASAPPAPQAPAQPPATPIEQQAQSTLGAVGQQQKSIQEQQAIDTAKAQAQVPIEQQQIQNAKDIQDRQNQTIAEMKQHTDEFADHLRSNPINPRAYGQNQTDDQKSQTAVGLFLGGLGGGGTSNLALDFLNKQIDRDIDSQKANRTGAENIFNAYQHLYQDENVSTALTKVSLNDRLIHQAQLVAANLGTQQAKQAADALASQKMLENTQLRTEAAALLNNQSESGSNRSGGYTAAAPGTSTYHILAPGAVQRSLGLSKVGIYDQDKLKSQLTSAAQAEKVLNGPKNDGVGGIRDLMDEMYHAIGKGSFTGGFEERMKSGIGHLPVIGGSAEGVANIVGQGEGYKNYRRASQQIKSDLGSALSGIVNPSDLDRMIDPNLPTLGDTPEDVQHKIDSIVQTVMKAVKTDEIQKAGLTAKGVR